MTVYTEGDAIESHGAESRSVTPEMTRGEHLTHLPAISVVMNSRLCKDISAYLQIFELLA